MEITFTLDAERTYVTTLLRDDGVLLRMQGYDRKSPLPHDLAHYIVEHGLGLKQGFWGRVAAGAVYPSMNLVSGRRPPHGSERSRQTIREAEQLGVEAEVWVGVLLRVMHEGLEENWTAVCARLHSEWRPQRPERALPNAEEVKRICIALREAERQWQTLEPGQALTVLWSPDRRRR